MSACGMLVAAAGAVSALLLSADPASAQVCPVEWRIDQGMQFDHSQAPLTELADLVVDRRGRVAVGDEKTNTIHLFWNGRLSGSLGRPGNGPGEFRHPDNMMVLVDSLFVTDTQLQRLTVFSPDGSVARTVSLRQSYAPNFLGDTYPFGGRLLMIPNPAASAVVSERGFSTPLLLLNADGSVADTAGTPLTARNGIAVISLPGGGEAYFPLPTPHADQAGMDPTGRGVVIARGAVGESGRSITVTKIGTNLDTIFTRVIRLPSLAVPKAFVDSAYDALVERYAPRFGSAREARSAIDRIWQVTDEVWPVQALVIDNDSRIWIRTGLVRNAWLVLDERGEAEACIELPRSVKLYAAQGQQLWTIHTDADHVQTVVQYRILN